MIMYEYAEAASSSQGSSRGAAALTGLSEAALIARFAELFPPVSRSGTPEAKPRPQQLPSEDEAPAADLSGNPYFAAFESSSGVAAHNVDDPSAMPLTDQQLTVSLLEQCRKAEERGRKEGFALGIASAQKEAAAQTAVERESFHEKAHELAWDFEIEKEDFFARAEQQTVKLALAIASRILHREAATDPLLLQNTVRQALRQLAVSTKVRLRVPLPDRGMWQDGFKRQPGSGSDPELIGDEGLVAGQCFLETELGTVDLSVLQQLDRIKQNLLDEVRQPNDSGLNDPEPNDQAQHKGNSRDGNSTDRDSSETSSRAASKKAANRKAAIPEAATPEAASTPAEYV